MHVAASLSLLLLGCRPTPSTPAPARPLEAPDATAARAWLRGCVASLIQPDTACRVIAIAPNRRQVAVMSRPKDARREGASARISVFNVSTHDLVRTVALLTPRATTLPLSERDDLAEAITQTAPAFADWRFEAPVPVELEVGPPPNRSVVATTVGLLGHELEVALNDWTVCPSFSDDPLAEPERAPHLFRRDEIEPTVTTDRAIAVIWLGADSADDACLAIAPAVWVGALPP